jgi:hypothetical protein
MPIGMDNNIDTGSETFVILAAIFVGTALILTLFGSIGLSYWRKQQSARRRRRRADSRPAVPRKL